MTRRYKIRTGMVEEDPDAALPREELVPGWRVPRRTRYDYDLRIGDAERDAAMAQLREHFVAGRLTFDELTERIDGALTAKTQRQIDGLMADLPRLRRTVRSEAALPAPAPDAGRFVVFAMLLFPLATSILIMACLAPHSYRYGYSPYPHFPGPPGNG